MALQDLTLGKNNDFHKKLFYLYYDNPVTMDWVTSVTRIRRQDFGSNLMFERVMCERNGYRGITKFLYEAYSKDEFIGFMGTKPGTVIRISVNDSRHISDSDMSSITSASDIVQINPMGEREIDNNKAAQYIYDGELSLIESHSVVNIIRALNKDRTINNGLNYKESFIISYLEQIAIYCIMHQEFDHK